MSVISTIRFNGSLLSEGTLNKRFDEVRGAIREKFKVAGIDVEQAVVTLQGEINRWKQAELQINPLLKRQIDHLASELTRKLYKHALQGQIAKTTRAFREYREQLDAQQKKVKKTMAEFAGRLQDFRDTPARHSRKKCLEFVASLGLDEKAIHALLDAVSEETHRTLSDGIGLAVRLAKGDLKAASANGPASTEHIPDGISGVKDLLKAIKEADAAFERASIPVEDGKSLDQIALEWIQLSEAAVEAPRIRKEAAERYQQAEAIYAKLPRQPKDVAEARENLRVADQLLVDLKAVRELVRESAELYAKMDAFAPYLGWGSVLADFQKDLDWRVHMVKTFCHRMKQEIEIFEQFIPVPQAERPKPPEAPPALVQPQPEKTAWEKFCDFWSGVATAIRTLFTGCRQPQSD